MAIIEYEENHIKLICLESDFLKVEIAPAVGGKITKIKDKKTGHQFLWKNDKLILKRYLSGSEYDANFYGGIDELLPNDMPEEINGVNAPDHGELWTMALDYMIEGEKLILSGVLPLCGLSYRREIRLYSDQSGIELKYKIANPTQRQKEFLWKFHAALNIQQGDRIISPSKIGEVADSDYTRWAGVTSFSWPTIANQRADIIPGKEGSVDFFFLHGLTEGYMGWHRPSKKLAFLYCFDKDIFPYNWYFASYGGFLNHYTAVLEPCTAMPLSVNEAAKLKQCTVLKAGEELSTTVRIYAGSDEIFKNK